MGKKAKDGVVETTGQMGEAMLFLKGYCTYCGAEGDLRVVQGLYRYGRARVAVYFLYDEKGGIQDAVFDLSDVQEKYGKEIGTQDVSELLSTLNRYTEKSYFRCRYETRNVEEFVGYGLAFYQDKSRLPEYFHVADVIKDVNEGLDRMLNKNLNLIKDLKAAQSIATKPLYTWFVLFGIAVIGFALGIYGAIAWVGGGLKFLAWVLIIGFALFAGFTAIASFANLSDIKKCKISSEHVNATHSNFN